MKEPSKTVVETLDAFPPFLVYYLTPQRKGLRTKIKKGDGFSLRTFDRIARQVTWAGIRVETIDAFCRRCGVHLLSTNILRRRLRRSISHGLKFRYLRGPLRNNMLKRFAKSAAEAKRVKSLEGREDQNPHG